LAFEYLGGGLRFRSAILADPNLRDFYGRISRIQAAKSGGRAVAVTYDFAEPIPQRKPQSRRLQYIKPIFLAVLLALMVKGAIHYKVGAATYDQRVEALAAGDGVDLVGAWLMQADPATLFVSDFIREMTR
jgi:hypothetical protein